MAELSQHAQDKLNHWMALAERIRTQKTKDKTKLYALHAPEAECIKKGKSRRPFEFGVKASIAVTHKQGLIIGDRTFPGNPYEGHTLAEQIEQTTHLLQDLNVKPTTSIVDLGYRCVDQLVAAQVIHRGRFKTMSAQHRKWLERRQAVEPVIGHLKADQRMDRCWLMGNTAMQCTRSCVQRDSTSGGCCRPLPAMGTRRFICAPHRLTTIVVAAVKLAAGHQLNNDFQLANVVG
jgi:IS5 family transposase